MSKVTLYLIALIANTIRLQRKTLVNSLRIFSAENHDFFSQMLGYTFACWIRWCSGSCVTAGHKKMQADAFITLSYASRCGACLITESMTLHVLCQTPSHLDTVVWGKSYTCVLFFIHRLVFLFHFIPWPTQVISIIVCTRTLCQRGQTYRSFCFCVYKIPCSQYYFDRPEVHELSRPVSTSICLALFARTTNACQQVNKLCNASRT